MSYFSSLPKRKRMAWIYWGITALLLLAGFFILVVLLERSSLYRRCLRPGKPGYANATHSRIC